MSPRSLLSFSDWQQLASHDAHGAARELQRRVDTLFSPAQRRAVVAWLPTEDMLAENFVRADPQAPLRGVPYFLKDLFDLAGLPTFGGSTFLPEVRPTPAHDSAIVQALHRAGAACAGKTHLHEFAYGLTGENPHYGDCEHPRFPGRTTGGSSSGSAAVVAAGITPFAIGTDTGGSVRLPAAFCGLFGFRLTPKHPWIADAFPLAPSCDTAGWFTARADDMLTANRALVGLGTTDREPRGCYLEFGQLEPDVAEACRAASARLCAPAETTTRGQLTAGFSRAAEIYNALTIPEAWQVHHTWAERYRDRYDPAVWQRLNRIHQLTGAEREAVDVPLTALRLLWTSFFLTFDFLVLPAAPSGAWTKVECTLANRSRTLALTAPASVGGLPVLSLPVPLPSGLSTGLQVIVNHPQSPVIPWVLQRWL